MNWQAEFLKVFEPRLRALLLAGVRDPKFQEAILYQFFPAGKRLRPLLMAAFSLDLSQTTENMIDFACAIEILHTASLIHDDLPALDDDIERRGRPTLHVKVGQGTALLVGDYLIARALAICAEASSQRAEICVTLSSTTAMAFCDLCFGQELDIRNSAGELEQSLELYDLKTGALFSLAFEIVRLLSLDSNQLSMQTQSFAKNFGRSFQVLNDVRDVQEERAEGQKERSSNSDSRNKRATALTLLSSEAHLEFVSSLHRETWHSLEVLEESLGKINRITSQQLVYLRSALQSVSMIAT